MSKKKFILNGAIISTSSLLLNIAGVFFNVYISNKVGAGGVGLFQLIMSVYGFSVTLACSGISLAATRLVSAELTEGKSNATNHIMKRCLQYSLFFGLLSFILLFFSSDFLAEKILCDQRTKMSLKALSISMVPISLSSAMSGYFIAVRRVYKSASAQIFEQIIRIGVCVISLEIFSHYGIEYACLCIIISGSVAEISSFIYLYILFVFDKRRYVKTAKKKTVSPLLSIALPVALSTYLRSSLVTIEHILIPKSLRKSGLDNDTALSCYGTIHGMALSVLMFPSAILKAFSSLLVPELSECATLGHNRHRNYIISQMIKMTMLFSICVSGLFFSFAKEIGETLYNNNDVGYYIRLLSPLCVIMYVDGIVDGMLKGLNQQLNSMWYNIIDAFVSVVCVIVLLPRYGAVGYIAVIYISELLNAFLSINRLIKITDFRLDFFSWIFSPAAIMYISGMIVKSFHFPYHNILELLVKSIICIIIYLITLTLLSVIEPKKQM